MRLITSIFEATAQIHITRIEEASPIVMFRSILIYLMNPDNYFDSFSNDGHSKFTIIMNFLHLFCEQSQT